MKLYLHVAAFKLNLAVVSTNYYEVMKRMKNIPLYEVRPIRTLKELLNSSVELFADKPALWVKRDESEDYQPITYKQYKDDVVAFGTGLLSLGLKGKRIAIIGENRYEWVTAYMAVTNGVGVVVPLDKELPENEIESLLIRSKADAIVFSGNLRNSISNISKRIDFISSYIDMDLKTGDTPGVISYQALLEKGYEMRAQGNTEFDSLEIDPMIMNILLFTSATTSKSKAVMLSQNNICKNLMAMASMTYVDEKDTFLSVLPLHHTYENTCGFLCALYRGCSVAFCEGLRHIPKNLQQSKASIMLGVPLIYESMYRRIWEQAAKNGLDKKLRFGIKLSNFLKVFKIDVTRKLFHTVHETFGGNIRLFISGAAGIDPNVSKGFRDLGIFFIQGYGLTECSPIVALNRDVDFKDDAAGLPLPGLEVKIDSPNDEGIGEIVVKGESIMLGYYENEEETNKVLKDGWFYTGDLGYIDNDGFIHITGRKKNVIVTKNGKNIYPEEIETLLDRRPYILESLVYGKTEEGSDEVMVAATIVPDMEKIKADHEGRELSKDEIYQLIQQEVKTVNKELVTYKYIREFNIREEEFAKTTTRKIKRYQAGIN